MTSGLAVVRQQQKITAKIILKVIITWYDCSVGLHILHGQLEYLLVLMDGAERRLGGQGGEVSPGGGHCHDSRTMSRINHRCHAALQQRLGANSSRLNSDLREGLSSHQTGTTRSPAMLKTRSTMENSNLTNNGVLSTPYGGSFSSYFFYQMILISSAYQRL